MKKLLLASTALVLSAGLAHAQGLNITGVARMGIEYDSTGFVAWGGSNYRQENRLQFNFNVSVEGDHGLTFGAYTRARMSTGLVGVFSGSRVWVQSNGLRLTFGNQDGAIQSVGVTGAVTIGYTGGTFAGGSAGMWIYPQGFSSTGPGSASRTSISYSGGTYNVMVSHDRAAALGVNSGTEVAANATFGAFTVAAGYANRNAGLGYALNTSIVTVSGRYNAGSWTVGAVVARLENFGGPGIDRTNFVVTGTAQLGGGNASVYAGRYYDLTPASDTTYGVQYSYGLGGGARIAGGIERVNTVNTANLGVVFTF